MKNPVKMEKLKLIGSGNNGRMNSFILEKKEGIFSLFPLLLISLGFKDIGVYDEYQTEHPNLDNLENSIENFSNGKYDIDIIYTHNRIIITIRTDESNREKIVSAIKKISNY